MANVSGVTRHFTTAQEGFTTTLSGSVSAGAATVPYNSLAGYTDGDEIALVIEPGTANEQTVIGTKSGTSMVNCVWTEGTNQPHAAGSTAVDYVSATQQSAQTKGTLVGHNQDGTHKPFAESGIVPTAAIQNGAVNDSKLDASAGAIAGAWQTWTPTLTGFSSNPANTSYRYRKVGKTVELALSQGTNGTSNSTAFTISLPFTAATITNMTWVSPPALVVDNGTFSTSVLGVGFINSGATTMIVSRDANGAGFTASGGKRITQMSITYETA